MDKEILKAMSEQIMATNKLVYAMNDELELIGDAANQYMDRVRRAVTLLLFVLVIQLLLMIYSMLAGGLM